MVGGASGIGAEVARRLLELGAAVTIVGRHDDRLAAAANGFASAGTPVTTQRADLHDPAAAARLAAAIGEVDHVVSMVGDPSSGGFLDGDLAGIRASVESKLFANLALARAFAPLLQERGSFTFTAGTGGGPRDAAGAFVGNAAVRILVRGLGLELAPSARANAVAPTWMRTPLWRDLDEASLAQQDAAVAAGIPLARTGTIPEVASAYLFCITNPFVTGQTIVVDGGADL